jgi:hypothetical protein
MTYQRPVVNIGTKRNLVRDEFWPLIVAGVVVYATNQYDLNRAVNACKANGGLAEVTSKWFGMSWEVKCK